jgi:hypothetical protein
MAGGMGVMLGLGEAVEDGADIGVEPGVGHAVADGGLLGLIVMLHPLSATSTHTAATRNRRADVDSGISTILVDGKDQLDGDLWRFLSVEA